MLREAHFPPPPEADLSDIEGYQYPEAVYTAPRIIRAEVRRAIKRTKKNNAPSPDDIPNLILHLIVEIAPEVLLRLYQAYLSLGIQPTAFKRATTVII